MYVILNLSIYKYTILIWFYKHISSFGTLPLDTVNGFD